MFLGDSNVEVAVGMRLLEMRKGGAARDGGGNGDNFPIRVGEFSKRFADDLGIGGRRGRWGFATLDLVFAEAVKFIRLLNGRLITFAFFGQNVQQDRFILSLEKFKCANQQRNIVSINRAVVAQTQFFEDNARDDQTFNAFFDLMSEVGDGFSSDRLDESARLVVQMRVRRTSRDIV